MSPQLLWTIAGLILTVLTLGGVTISSYQSQDAAKGKLVAAEVANIATAAKLWLANDSTTRDYQGVDFFVLTPYIPDLTTNSYATMTFDSKAIPGAYHFIVPANGGAAVEIQTWLPGDAANAFPQLESALTNKACTMVSTPALLLVTYTCAK